MITKKELKNYVHLRKEIEQLQERIKKLNLQMYMVGSTKITGAPGGSGSPAKIVDNISRLDELVRYYMDKFQTAVMKQEQIEKEIEQLPE